MQDLSPPPQSSQELPALDVASALSLLGAAVDGAVLEALEGTGLRQSHGYLIQRLLLGPATATQMATDLGVSQQAVSKALKELLALGHLEPAPDQADRRRHPVQLSPSGRHAVLVARDRRARLDARLREVLGDDGFEVLRSALTEALRAFDLSERVRRRTVPPPSGTVQDP